MPIPNIVVPPVIALNDIIGDRDVQVNINRDVRVNADHAVEVDVGPVIEDPHLLDDYNHRYVDSYFSILHKGKKRAIKTLRFFIDNGVIVSEYHDSSWGTTNDIDISKIDFTYPDLGIVKWRDSVVYISRSGRNIWRQGLIYDRGISIYDPLEYDSIMLESPFNRTRHKRGILTNIFNPVRRDINTAMEMIRSFRHRAVPISRNLFVAIHSLNELPVIGYKRNIIGVVNPDNSVSISNGLSNLLEEVSEHAVIKQNV